MTYIRDVKVLEQLDIWHKYLCYNEQNVGFIYYRELD